MNNDANDANESDSNTLSSRALGPGLHNIPLIKYTLCFDYNWAYLSIEMHFNNACIIIYVFWIHCYYLYCI